MHEQQLPDISDIPIEDRLRRATRLWHATFFATIDYLREQGISPVDFAHWLGRRFAPGWVDMHGNMQKIAYYVALNAISTGSELQRYDVSDDEATIQLRMGQESEYEDDVDALEHIYVPIMESLDLDYEWEKVGEQEEVIRTVRLRRRAAA